MKPVELLSRYVFSLGAGAALGLSAFFYTGTLLPAVGVCWMREYTGLPCPGCGLTRSFCAISHGQFAEAWALNPFGYLFYSVAIWLVALPLLGRRWPGLGARLARARWFPVSVIVLVVAMWVFNLWRWGCSGATVRG